MESDPLEIVITGPLKILMLQMKCLLESQTHFETPQPQHLSDVGLGRRNLTIFVTCGNRKSDMHAHFTQ